jgi:hypothetical protein
MSLPRARYTSVRKSLLRNKKDESTIRTLVYHDQDSDGYQSCHDADVSSTPSSPTHYEPESMESSAEFLDIDLPTPSPVSSPQSRRITRSRRMSPIPFCLDGDDSAHESEGSQLDDEEQRVPGTDTISPCSSPPHRRLRALRLFDTPHTPKSLLHKSRRRRLTDERERQRKTSGKLQQLQANVNPFTPNNNRPQPSSTGGKRNRTDFERY